MRLIRSFLRKYAIPTLILSLFFAMLLFPAPVLRGASLGLLLWFHTVLPTLFPFLLICSLLIRTPAIHVLLRLAGPPLCRLFHVSPYGSFAVLCGFLCGYPMGAKMSADLYRQGAIGQEEARYLLSFCNNTSPMFILSFLVMQHFKDDALKLPTLGILILSPIIISFFMPARWHTASPYNSTRPRMGKPLYSSVPTTSSPCAHAHPRIGSTSYSNSPTTSSLCASARPRMRDASFSDALEFSISNALDAITKVGVYIMIFSIFIELFLLLPLKDTPLRLMFLSSLEVTNGISLLCSSNLKPDATYILCLSLTSFGGLCAAAQTASMIKGCDISIVSYLAKKLATALVASLLALLYLYMASPL